MQSTQAQRGIVVEACATLQRASHGQYVPYKTQIQSLLKLLEYKPTLEIEYIGTHNPVQIQLGTYESQFSHNYLVNSEEESIYSSSEFKEEPSSSQLKEQSDCEICRAKYLIRDMVIPPCKHPICKQDFRGNVLAAKHLGLKNVFCEKCLRRFSREFLLENVEPSLRSTVQSMN